MYNNEITHYGRKGMKWYQTIFTKKTSEGGSGDAKKKVKQSKTDIKDEKSKSKEDSSEEKPKTKKISEMSEAELKERISRLSDEKRIMELERDIKSLAPDTRSSGKKFIEDNLLPTVMPEVTKALVGLGKEKMGLGEKKSAMDKLKDAAAESKLKRSLAQDRDYFERREANARANSETQSNTRRNESQNGTETSSSNRQNENTESSSRQTETSSSNRQTETSSSNRQNENTESSSRQTERARDERNNREPDIIDAEWRDITPDETRSGETYVSSSTSLTVSPSRINRGSQYISALLEG